MSNVKENAYVIVETSTRVEQEFGETTIDYVNILDVYMSIDSAKKILKERTDNYSQNEDMIGTIIKIKKNKIIFCNDEYQTNHIFEIIEKKMIQ
jgi:hypothetical protein